MNIGNNIKLNKLNHLTNLNNNPMLELAASNVWYSDKGPSRLLVREETIIEVNRHTIFILDEADTYKLTINPRRVPRI